jgi:hypothetical protein
LEVSIHAWLDHWFWACGEAKHCGVEQEQVDYKESDRKPLKRPIINSKARKCSNWIEKFTRRTQRQIWVAFRLPTSDRKITSQCWKVFNKLIEITEIGSTFNKAKEEIIVIQTGKKKVKLFLWKIDLVSINIPENVKLLEFTGQFIRVVENINNISSY